MGQVHFSDQCASGVGVGVAFDGTWLWYTCHAGSPDLLRADPKTGLVTASYNITNGLGALAYDATRNAIWAAPGGGVYGAIWLIKLDASQQVTSSAIAFNAADDADGLDDGIAFDAEDDTLYFKPDNSNPIHHYKTDGTKIGEITGASSCFGPSTSGLAIGGDLLFEGKDGCSHVFVVNKHTLAPAFDFDTKVAGDANFRDEGLTCDTKTFAPVQVMWSKEAYAPMRASAFAIPEGTCGVGGKPAANTTLTYTGDTTRNFNDPATLSATLTDTSANKPIAGATIDFTLDGQSCSGTTDAAGSASCTLTPNEAAGSYPLTAKYAGDASHSPASFSGTFRVTLEEDTVRYTGPTVLANGGNATLSGRLLEDGTTPIAGRTLSFTLGSGGSAQSCSGVTNGSGDASCTLVVAQPLGPDTVTVRFASDGYYVDSHDAKPVIVFAFPAGGGAFVIGDRSASGHVQFWGAQWAKNNVLTGGAAPNSFKGFAENPGPSCGSPWATDPGNSSGPPASLPSYMGVIVASSIGKSGPVISGDAVRIVVVQTDAGYEADPGHAGTGTVVADVCP